VTRRKAQDAANAQLGLRHQEAGLVRVMPFGIIQQRREIVIEGEGPAVNRIALTVVALVARTQVAPWIVRS
jgi:hypothetical protein